MHSEAVLEQPQARSRPAPDSVAFVFKIAERCNLACSYCYFFFGGDESYKQHPPFVLPSTIDGLIAFVLGSIEDHGIRNVRIGFHGGEPLLLKKARFDEMCERLTEAIGTRCNLSLSVQTNGVLVDSEWVALFQKYGIHAGISFDGPPEFHNTTRITKKGRGTYAETRRGWDMLMEASREGRVPAPGVLCVVDPQQSGAATFRHLIEELGALHMDFLLPDVTHDSPDANEEFVKGCGDYLIEICHSWFDLGRSDVHVRFIDHVMGPLLDDGLMRLSAATKNDPRSIFTISSNGEISPDDAMRPLAPRFREAGLRVGHDTLGDVLAHDVWRELMASQDALAAPCQTCTWKGICNGGVRQHRFSEHNGFDNPSLYCSTLKRIYAYIATQLIRGGCSVDEFEKRLASCFAG
ncbi:MAG TPA: radical SAM protein [Candidatus Elarobacter sp.]|nr:radical SAM protein [Candidatus Elarobacter sp.]